MKLLFEQAKSAPVLKVIVKMGSEVTDEEMKLSNETGIKIYSFKEIEVGVASFLPTHLL